MSKELEAIKHIKEIPTARSLTFEDGSNLIEIIEKALKRIEPQEPTAEEVCEALSEQLHNKEVIYDKERKAFYYEWSFNGETGIAYACYYTKFVIKFEFPFPPHIVELVGKFYKHIKKEG